MDKPTAIGTAVLVMLTLCMGAWTHHPAALLFGFCLTAAWVIGGLCRN